MRVMVPLNSNQRCLRWASQHPGQFGYLVGPSYYHKNPIRAGITYAVDNDAWKAFRDGTPWDEALFFQMLSDLRAAPQQPAWVAVPDVVANPKVTLANWERYSERIRAMGYRTRFVVQDGMSPESVPAKAEGVFVGGSTRWKWKTAPMWCQRFLTHIGRVNNLEMVALAESMGAESVDGSGWHRREPHRWSENFNGLEDWFNGWRSGQTKLAL